MEIKFSGHSAPQFSQKPKRASADDAPKLQFGQASDVLTTGHNPRPSRFKLDAHAGCDQYPPPSKK